MQLCTSTMCISTFVHLVTVLAVFINKQLDCLVFLCYSKVLDFQPHLQKSYGCLKSTWHTQSINAIKVDVWGRTWNAEEAVLAVHQPHSKHLILLLFPPPRVLDFQRNQSQLWRFRISLCFLIPGRSSLSGLLGRGGCLWWSAPLSGFCLACCQRFRGFLCLLPLVLLLSALFLGCLGCFL